MHTKGRWEAVLDNDPRGQPVSYHRGVIALLEKGDRYLAVVSDGRTVTRDEWEPNARLIAAAPMLLEAAEAVLAWAKRECVDVPELDQLAQAIRSAIGDAAREGSTA